MVKDRMSINAYQLMALVRETEGDLVVLHSIT